MLGVALTMGSGGLPEGAGNGKALMLAGLDAEAGGGVGCTQNGVSIRRLPGAAFTKVSALRSFGPRDYPRGIRKHYLKKKAPS